MFVNNLMIHAIIYKSKLGWKENLNSNFEDALCYHTDYNLW